MKNRFSMLLEHLSKTADVKHYVLADYLQYDTSYISKWISGKLLPGEKGKESVLEGLSNCLVERGRKEGIEYLMAEYGTEDVQELGQVLYQHMIREYDHVRSMQSWNCAEEKAEVAYYPLMTLHDYIERIHMPLAYGARSIDIINICDIGQLTRDMRFEFISFNTDGIRRHKETHVSINMVFDERTLAEDCLYNTLLLTNMLTMYADIDMNIYANSLASGRVIYILRDQFLIHGMIKNTSQCIGVTACEGEKYVRPLYNESAVHLTKDTLMFVKKDVDAAVDYQDFVFAFMAPDIRLVLGAVCDLFLPPSLMEKLLDRYKSEADDKDHANIHNICTFRDSALQGRKFKILIYESALYEFALDGRIDYFDHSITLDYRERLQVFEYLLHALDEMPDLEIHMIHGRLSTVFKDVLPASMFISDTASYIMVRDHDTKCQHVLEINRTGVQKLYAGFFEQIWNYRDDLVISGEAVRDFVLHLKNNVAYLCDCLPRQ